MSAWVLRRGASWRFKPNLYEGKEMVRHMNVHQFFKTGTLNIQTANIRKKHSGNRSEQG